MAVSGVGPPKLGRYHLLEGVISKTFTPREYEVELLDISRKKNTVVCVASDSSKTFITVMLIKELAHETRLSLKEGGKRTVVLVPDGQMVHQQSKVIQDHTDLKVGQLFKVDVNTEWKNVLVNEVNSNNVIVCTPDVFKMTLCHNALFLSSVNLVIFYDCHKAVESHAFCDIMMHFDVIPVKDQPHILGLSTSMITSGCRASKLEQDIRSLGFMLKSTVETASDLTMLSKYGCKPQEYLVEYELFSSEYEFEKLLTYINSALVFFDDLALYFHQNHQASIHFRSFCQYLTDTAHILLNLGPWCTLKAVPLFVKEMYSLLDVPNSDVPKVYFVLVVSVLHQVAAMCRRIVCESGENGLCELLHYASPKMKQLVNLLQIFRHNTHSSSTSSKPCLADCAAEKSVNVIKSDAASEVDEESKSCENVSTSVNQQTEKSCSSVRTFSQDDAKDFCCVIFVQSCVIAYLVNLWLSHIRTASESFKFISSSYMVGHGMERFKKVIPACRQEEVLRKFRSREYNVIVATSFVEQSLNIPKCNLIISFDVPSNFRSYIHSKGRVRDLDSVFILMVDSTQRNVFIEHLCDFKAIEQILLQNAHKSDVIDDYSQHEDVDKMVHPFAPVAGDGSPQVTMSSAIGLVNRYCAKLPSDTFTRLTPKWKIKEIVSFSSKRPLYQCIVKMPINSPLKKPVVGLAMPSQHLAKMSAALETCKELHSIGELDDNLLPTGKEALKLDDQFNDAYTEENETASYARPGSTKRRQYYSKQISEALKDSMPVAGVPSFLYLLRMILTCPLPDEQNTRGRKIHDPASTSKNFGILLSKRIPPICSFPVFTRSGEVTVHIEQLSCSIVLNDEQLEELSHFHNYTFSDVLRLEKYPMTFSPSESEFSFLIVPVELCSDTNTYSVDWDFVHLIYKQKDVKPKKFSEQERQSFVFSEEKYNDAVVMPWYRNLDKPQFFYVAEICFNLTPLSQFPDEVFGTFKEYYEKKYQISIMNSAQPLLDVDHTSARLNLLTPRYVNRKGITLPTTSASTKKTKRENLQQKQILIPELCIIHPFPASLWRKAVCLPCILYRTNCLLLAEQLRSAVARDISLGIKCLSADFNWPALDFGWTLSDVVKNQAVAEDSAEPALQKSNCKWEEKVRPEFVHDQLQKSSVTENCELSGVTPEKEDTESMDFEIDVFDPSKYHIPEDDFIDKELDFSDFNFDSSFPITGAWNSPGSPSALQEPIIRYGSPSNFEDSQDFDWNSESEGTNFFVCNTSGLSYISGPQIFNMESFTLDLESCKDDSYMWDSFDESSLSDETEPIKAFSKDNTTNSDILPLASQLESSDRKLLSEHEAEPSELPISASTVEFHEFGWQPPPCTFLGTVEQQKELYTVHKQFSYTTRATVASIEENKRSSIKFLNVKPLDENNQHDCQRLIPFPLHMFLCTMNSEACCEEIRYQSKDFPHEKSFGNVNCRLGSEMKSEGCSSLAFGELLKNREECIKKSEETSFSFDDCPDLSSHPGPNPSLILQAFTMSNANDGINLERLETVGDSFLKYAITAFLFCKYPDIHEGKLSFLRSKQISNLNLYRLGRRKCFGEMMVATKFEPNDNWLPPCYIVPTGLEQALIDSGLPASKWNILNSDTNMITMSEIYRSVLSNEKVSGTSVADVGENSEHVHHPPVIPYNLLTQHSIPDKSIADCVEALIGAYLVSCGSRGATLFMSWLGLHVLPRTNESDDDGSKRISFGYVQPPPSPLIYQAKNVNSKLEKLLSGYTAFEEKIGYTFRDKSYLLQAFTHASYYYNTLTDCYQRLEFLGDAVLDYLITRHLYEDPRKHSPGTLTDLRSALVNNTFFASLAVKYDFHKYFKAVSPSLFNVINRFVELKEHSTIEDYIQSYYLAEDECEEVEEVEVPKALGDIFESVAGAIYLDSTMSLDDVWKVYYAMMKPEIEYFSNHVPKSPIRELLELEPQRAKFQKAEMTLSGKVRVRVEIFGKGHFTGIGRNKRIAKCTAAKRALRELKKREKELSSVSSVVK